MNKIDGYAFWRNVDKLLEDHKITYKELSLVTGIEYRAVTTQRNRHSIPKAEQLLIMAEFLKVSVDSLLRDDAKISPEAQRIEKIKKACWLASEEDLLLVERILRIDGKNAFDNLAKPYTLRADK